MKRAEKQAYKVLRDHSISKPPVPVEKIATALGASLSYEPFEDKDAISGMLFRDGSRTVIGINSSHGRTRQRFSIAHELGHLVLHEGKLFVDKVSRINLRDETSSKAIDREEIEANSFAAALLMPEDLVVSEVAKRLGRSSKIKPDILIPELAKTFDVSNEAMDYRLRNLGILVGQF